MQIFYQSVDLKYEKRKYLRINTLTSTILHYELQILQLQLVNNEKYYANLFRKIYNIPDVFYIYIKYQQKT